MLSRNPSPVILAQDAVKRLPRWILFALCIAYVLAGYLGREPWREDDMGSFGYMLEMAQYPVWSSAWFHPKLVGVGLDHPSLLAYWLGAMAMKLLPQLDAFAAARLPFMLSLTLSMVATWYAIYHFARHPLAQPVSFAFGGEAQPRDYAVAVADTGLLALLATLGFYQFSHEITPAIVQVFFSTLALYGIAASRWRPAYGAIALAIALPALALSGATSSSLCYAILAVGHYFRSQYLRPWWYLLAVFLAEVVAMALSWEFSLWQWQLQTLQVMYDELTATLKLLVWFTWPVGTVALWALWRWRALVWHSSHLFVPLVFACWAVFMALFTPWESRALLLALPALSALAAFALPTLSRRALAFIDWFTLLLFTLMGLVFWVFWFSMHFGFPAKPAENISRLAPGFKAEFSWWALLVGLVVSLAWWALVAWRTSRHRKAMWKSMALPAGGAIMTWVLGMSLFLPVLDYARSQYPLAHQFAKAIPEGECVLVHGLTESQMTALIYYENAQLFPAHKPPSAKACPWLLVNKPERANLAKSMDLSAWRLQKVAREPTNRNDNADILLYRRLD